MIVLSGRRTQSSRIQSSRIQSNRCQTNCNVAEGVNPRVLFGVNDGRGI